MTELRPYPLIALVALLAARLARSAGPQIEHRIWVAALMLEVTLPACAFAPALRSFLLSLIHGRSGLVTAQVTTLSATTATGGNSHLAAITASGAVIAYIATLLYLFVRLIFWIRRTESLRRTAQSVALAGEALNIWQRCTRIFGVHNAQAAVSAHVAGPSTIGIRRRIVLLPPMLLKISSHKRRANPSPRSRETSIGGVEHQVFHVEHSLVPN